MLFEILIKHFYTKAFIYELVVMLATYFILNLLHMIKCRYKRYQLFRYHAIPGPKPRLLDGSWLEYDYSGNKLELDRDWKNKYGRLFGFYLGDEPNIMTTDLDVLKRVFVEDRETFCERSKTVVDIPLTRGLLYARYPRWKTMRSMLSPAFSKFHRRGGKASEFVEDTLNELIDYIDTKWDSCKTMGKVCVLDIRSLMKSTSLNLINKMAIGLPGMKVREHDTYVEQMDRFIEEGNRGFVVLAIIAPHFRRLFSFFMRHFELHKMFGTIHRTLDQIIEDGAGRLRKQFPLFTSRERSFDSLKNECLITRPASSNNVLAQQAGEEQVIDTMVRLLHEGRLSRKELYGTAEIILMAGYDTTATTLAYTFWVIANDEQLQTRLRSTLVTHGIESRFLKQVIDETMRLYPVAPYITTRLATKTTTIKGWTIPQGTKVLYNSWLIHRDPEIWKDPVKFDPHRFDEGNDYHPCAFAPFGLGEKRCLAYQLAQLQMKMIICDILLRYKIKLVRPKQLEIEPIGFVTTQPKEEVFIEMERIAELGS